MSFYYDDVHYNTQSAEEILPYLFTIYRPGSVIDVGCGIGTWLSVANRLGITKIYGIDESDYDPAKFKINEEFYAKASLLQPLIMDEIHDLCICLEVAEHLPEQQADQFIALLCQSAPVVLFSAAIPGQPGQGHVNCQWPNYWQFKFSNQGYVSYDILRSRFWRNTKVDWWYKQNMILFARPGMIKNHYPMEVEIPEYIHPELYKIKIEEIEQLHDIKVSTVFNPSFPFAIRSLAKSVIVTPWKNKKK